MGGDSNGVYGDLDNQAVFRFVHIVAFNRSTFNIKNLPNTWNIAEIANFKSIYCTLQVGCHKETDSDHLVVD